MRRPAGGWFVLMILAGAARALPAQAVRVEVRDSLSGAPLAHALVSVRREDGTWATEAASGASGVRTFRLPAAGTYRVRVRRIGHRPFEAEPVTVPGDGERVVVLRVPVRPVALGTVSVAAPPTCRDAARSALPELWEAIGTGLATVAAARADDAPPLAAAVVDRRLDVEGNVEDARLRSIALVGDARPFRSADPDTLARLGYVVGQLRRGADFHAPDERVLVSDGFVATHCFTPVRGTGATSGLVGVRFAPVRGRRVADIAGTIWLDSASAEPRRVEFAYVWDRLPREARASGGTIEFGRLPGGALGVVSWRVRIPLLVEYFDQLRLDGFRERAGEIRAAAAP